MLDHQNTESKTESIFVNTEEESGYRLVPALSVALNYFQHKTALKNEVKNVVRLDTVE